MQKHCTHRPDSVWVWRTQFAIYLRPWVPTAILKRRTIWTLMSFPSFPSTTWQCHTPFPGLGLVTVAVPVLVCLAQRTSMNRAGSRRPWPVGRWGMLEAMLEEMPSSWKLTKIHVLWCFMIVLCQSWTMIYWAPGCEKAAYCMVWSSEVASHVYIYIYTVDYDYSVYLIYQIFMIYVHVYYQRTWMEQGYLFDWIIRCSLTLVPENASKSFGGIAIEGAVIRTCSVLKKNVLMSFDCRTSFHLGAYLRPPGRKRCSHADRTGVSEHTLKSTWLTSQSNVWTFALNLCLLSRCRDIIVSTFLTRSESSNSWQASGRSVRTESQPVGEPGRAEIDPGNFFFVDHLRDFLNDGECSQGVWRWIQEMYAILAYLLFIRKPPVNKSHCMPL